MKNAMSVISVENLKKTCLQWFVLVGFIVFPAKAQVIPIEELHFNDEQGIPAAPYNIGSEVRINGVVTAGTGTFADIRTEIFIQDSTGGILVYRSDFIYDVELGDSVTIDGVIDQYQGTTEVIPTSVTIDGTGAAIPEPRVLTCADLTGAFQPDYSEPNESRLVTVRSASYDADSETISDGTGTCTLYIDSDTGIGDVISGTYDITGILKQWDFSAPYTEYYELLPRFPDDIQASQGPNFTAEPQEMNLQYDGFDIVWTTDTPATTELLVGLENPGDIVTLVDPELEISHTVSVADLQPATIYKVQAISSDAEGVTRSPVWRVSTSSPPECSGSIIAHFNQSVETRYVLYDYANGDAQYQRRLLDRINGAEFSIDACLYSLTVPEITSALIIAKNRGVRVRFIYEADNENGEITQLQQAGIPILNDESGSNNGSGLMHNKFFVFDFLDQSCATNDYVWTGSANISYNGFHNNAENVVIIQDQALAGAYTAEFEEMWGGSEGMPVESEARFGSRKTDNVPHRFRIGEIDVCMYTSPSDEVASHMHDFIMSAERSIFFSIYNFTNDDISESMRMAGNANSIEFSGVFDANQISSSSEYWPMSGQGSGAWNPPADVHSIDLYPSFHHKYMLRDADNLGTYGAVLTGSYNWSFSAETIHDENILIIYDGRIANHFVQEFMARYEEAGGSDSLVLKTPDVAQPVVSTIRIHPNPWVRGSDMFITGPDVETLEIYDIHGRRIPFGMELIDPLTRRVHGLVGTSGVYFLTIGTLEGKRSIPLVRVQ